jgi:heme exporter protein D
MKLTTFLKHFSADALWQKLLLDVVALNFAAALTWLFWQQGNTFLYVVIIMLWLGSVLNLLAHLKQFAARQKREQQLKTEVGELEAKRIALTKEELEHSEVYAKIKRIVNTLRKEYTKETLDEAEWQQFLVLIDKRWNGVASFLQIEYHLTADELHICCLYLINTPVSHIGHFVNGYARNTIQLKAKGILAKMNAPEGMLLQTMLQQIITSLPK